MRRVPAWSDAVILVATLAGSFLLRGSHLLSAQLFLSFAPLVALWMATFYAFGLYETQTVRDLVALTSGLFASAAASAVIGTIYFYLLSPYLGQTPKTLLVMTVIGSHVLAFAWRRAWLWALDIHLLRLNLVILGDEEHVRAFESSRWRWPGTDMVVADPAWVEENWDAARVVLAEAVAHRVPVVSLDAFYESVTGKVSPEWASRPSWAIEHVLPRTGSSYAGVKRGLDVAAAAVLLTAAAPVLAATYAAIYFVDGMSPLYGQRRSGFLGTEFTLWKFRTMRPGADAHGPFRRDREAPTRLGAFLRRYRFDELPQLWNVLRGEMSMVGPRPEWIKEVEVLEKAVPNYHLRHLVPPGITGWAQVYYRATNDPSESLEKHHYDLYYLKHFSFALDFSILLKTLKRVCVRDSHVPAGSPFFVRRSSAAFDVGSLISRS
jgi:lipopolysaccharide/colanic/teichoic acid biosynthesis glycosyltransferase